MKTQNKIHKQRPVSSEESERPEGRSLWYDGVTIIDEKIESRAVYSVW